MSFTSEVSAFMETLGPFYEPVEEDEENQTSRRLRNANHSKRSEQSKEVVKEDTLAIEQFNLETSLNDADERSAELVHRGNNRLHINTSIDNDSKLNPIHEGCNNDNTQSYHNS